MFDYMKFTKLLPTICDDQRVRFAARTRLPIKVLSYLTNCHDINVEGCINFHEEGDIRIFIIYGKSEYAMVHDLIDGKYTFCIFVDYIIDSKYKYMDIFDMMFTLVKHIISYANIKPPNTAIKSYIKDTYRETFNIEIKNVCAYTVWAVFGDVFLNEYKLQFPKETEIDQIMKVFEESELDKL